MSNPDAFTSELNKLLAKIRQNILIIINYPPPILISINNFNAPIVKFFTTNKPN